MYDGDIDLSNLSQTNIKENSSIYTYGELNVVKNIHLGAVNKGIYFHNKDNYIKTTATDYITQTNKDFTLESTNDKSISLISNNNITEIISNNRTINITGNSMKKLQVQNINCIKT